MTLKGPPFPEPGMDRSALSWPDVRSAAADHPRVDDRVGTRAWNGHLPPAACRPRIRPRPAARPCRAGVEPFIRFSQEWIAPRIHSGTSRTAAFSPNGLGPLGPGDPRYEALAKVDLSYAHIKAGRWPEAIEAARAALALDPANAIAWANLGVALYKLGHVADARQALDRSLALNPGNEPLRSVLAQLPPPQ